jgi:hypothetical protein
VLGVKRKCLIAGFLPQRFKHGLRHGMANDRYAEETGASSPVVFGGRILSLGDSEGASGHIQIANMWLIDAWAAAGRHHFVEKGVLSKIMVSTTASDTIRPPSPNPYDQNL